MLLALGAAACQNPEPPIQATRPAAGPPQPPPRAPARELAAEPERGAGSERSSAAPQPAPSAAPPVASGNAPASNAPPQPAAPGPPPQEGSDPSSNVTPPYARILKEIDPRGRTQLVTGVSKPRTLSIDTTNVQRLLVTREGLPLARNRSVVLRIDGKGIEWTPKYESLELERSSSGDWQVVALTPAP
jgi:hypothetical protein